MKELSIFRDKINCLPDGAVEAEVQAEKQDILSTLIIDDKPAGSETSNQTALFARVSGTKTGMVYTQKLDEEPMHVIKLALDNSKYSQSNKIETMNTPESCRTAMQEEEKQHTDLSVLKQYAADLEETIRSSCTRLSYSSVALTETIYTNGLVNSKGCNLTSSTKTYEATVNAAGEKYGTFSMEFEKSAESLEQITAKELVEKIKNREACQLPKCEGYKGTLAGVIDGSVMCNMLITAWQMFSGTAYVNHATALNGKLGEQVFSKFVDITDFPQINESGYKFPFDCEGTCGAIVNVVEKGIFNNLLHNLSTAEKMGAISTGNAGRKALLSGTIHTDTTVIPKNLCILPGSSTFMELVEEIENGIYIFESYDVFHSINIASGDFSIPCKGIRIQNGKQKGAIDNLTLNGNIVELLNSVEAVGNELTVLPLCMLKSYTVSAPSVKVSSLHISGGA